MSFKAGARQEVGRQRRSRGPGAGVTDLGACRAKIWRLWSWANPGNEILNALRCSESAFITEAAGSKASPLALLVIPLSS